MAFETVVFNEGEPLDPAKLNKLQANVQTSYQTSNLIYDSTIGNQSAAYIPVIDCGSIQFGTIPNGKTVSKSLQISSIFDGVGIPKVTATFRNPLGDGDIISVSVSSLGTSPTISVSNKCGKDRSNVFVDWIAVAKKTIS